MVTLSSCLIWQIISFILPPNEYGCVYAWTTLGSGPAIDLQKMPILTKKKIIFSDEAHFDLGGYGSEKLSHLGHRKPASIHWKADAPKTSHCLVRIVVQRHNWAIFLWKWARRDRYSQWRSLAGYVERIFVHKNLRGGYWQHLISTGWGYVPHWRSYTPCFAPCFWRSHYQPQADVIWSSRSSDLTPLYYYLWGAVKPEKIDALKDNIREAIGEIQLHTIDNMLKNWTDCVGYCMASRGSHLMKLFSLNNRKDCIFK